MAEKTPLDQAIQLARATDALPPSVDPVEIHVRSDVQFLFRDPLKRGVPPEVQAQVKQAYADGWLLGAFIVEWGYDVDRKRISEFHRWLQDHEQGIVDSQPEDVNYRGTYAVFSTTEKKSGTYRTVWAFASYNGLQNFGFRIADENSPFSLLITDMVRFMDRDHGAGTSQQVYQPAQSALNIWALADRPA